MRINRKKVCFDIPDTWYNFLLSEARKKDATVTTILRELISEKIDGPILDRLAGPCPVLDNQLELKGLENERTAKKPDGAGGKTPGKNKQRDTLSVPRKRK